MKPIKQKTNNGANVGYEAELWQMADALRGSIDVTEYKHVLLGLIFIVPSVTAVHRFYTFAQGLLGRSDELESEFITLAALGDALLPKHTSDEKKVNRFLPDSVRDIA